jgi:hypothetical protein
MDISSITAALSGIKNATDIAKAIKSIEGQYETAELKLKIVDLIDALSEAKMSIADIKTLLIEKDEEISKLKTVLATKDDLINEHPYYWKESDGKREGPYCQKCWEVDQILVHLQGGANGSWGCANCKSPFKDKNFRPKKLQVISGPR